MPLLLGGGGVNNNGNGAPRNGIEAMAALIGRQDGQTRGEAEEFLDRVEEERRLAHVVVTRAREKLYLSYLERNAFGAEIEISPILETVMKRCKDVVEVEGAKEVMKKN